MLAWLLGSVENRDWPARSAGPPVPMLAGVGLSLYAARGLSMLTLGEETAALSGLPMARLRACAVAGASLLTGAAVALAGVIGFVGLAAPHLVRAGGGQRAGRASCRPRRWPARSCWSLADLAARGDPDRVSSCKLGVVTALFGAPLFALIAWRAARSWRG